MKRILYAVLLALAFTVIFAPATNPPAQAFAPAAVRLAPPECTKIKDGSIVASTGETLRLGYDQYGYNYQAHIFNGTYDSVDRKLDDKYWGVTADYVDDSLIMKWSDDWLSNQDCTGDGKLDRDGDTNISKGWTTNLVEGDYMEGEDSYHYTYFVKIVYDPNCSTSLNGCIWGTYTIIEEVYNDPHGGYHGVDRSRLDHPAGLGFYTR